MRATAIVSLLLILAGCADPAHNYTWQRRGQAVGDAVARYCREHPAADERATFWDAVKQRAPGSSVLVTCP